MVILVGLDYAAANIFTNIGLVYLYQAGVIISSIYTAILFLMLLMDITDGLYKSAKAKKTVL